ncbi:hypothetical protein BJ165DRAFT_1496577 [Panaeolus papilionaceus]|nr:hypothetical protein BJ165DRAFT_1496577 [Panaeolus papilionaceus]
MTLRPARWNIPDDESDLTEPPTSEEEDELEGNDANDAPQPQQVVQPPSPPRPPSPPPKYSGRAKPTRPSTQQATQQSRARRDRSKENRPTLTETVFLTHPVYFLVDLMAEGRIDVNPEYQRGVVWSDTKQGGFIDSLLNNYHTPSIVLAKGYNDDGMDVWRCIDGKQRLTSLFRFLHGEIPYKDSQSNKKYWFVNQPGQKRRLMPPVLRSKLREKRIKIDEYMSITEEQERAVFQRVQLGVVLGPADRLPAINGANADMIRELRRRINTTEGFDGYLDWGRARGKDFQALARIVYFVAFGQTRKWDPIATRLETWLGTRAENYNKLREKAIQTIDIFCRISSHPTLSVCFDKLSPLEFVMSNYLISREKDRLTDSQLSAAITRMRQDYVSQKKDFKCGNVNYKVMTTFIDKQLPKIAHSLAKLPDEKVAAITPFDRRELPFDQFMDLADKPPPSEPSNKRKRESTAEDDGDMADSEEDDCIVKAKPAVKKLRDSVPAASTPMRQVSSSSKPSLAKTTVKRTPASLKRKAEVAASAPSTNSVAVKAPPSSTHQVSIKPSPLSRNATASGSGTSTFSATSRPTTGALRRPSTQQNFQNGSSQPVSQMAGVTGRAASDRLGPLKRARAETQINSQQSSPHLSGKSTSDPAWLTFFDAMQSNVAPVQGQGQGAQPPVLAVAQTEPTRAGPSTNPRLSLQIPQQNRQESLGSPLSSISASPSPMPSTFSPQFVQAQQRPPQSQQPASSHPQQQQQQQRSQPQPQPQPQPQQPQQPPPHLQQRQPQQQPHTYQQLQQRQQPVQQPRPQPQHHQQVGPPTRQYPVAQSQHSPSTPSTPQSQQPSQQTQASPYGMWTPILRGLLRR